MPAVSENVPYLRETPEGIYLSLKVQPRASRNEIGDVLGHELKLGITAPPTDNAANEAIIEFLAKHLKCAKGQVQLSRGRTSRHKVLFLKGIALSDIVAKLPGRHIRS